MAVERRLQEDPTDPFGLLPEDEDFDIEPMETDDGVIEDEDGGATIVLDEGEENTEFASEHDANLAESMSDGDLVALSSELVHLFDNDKMGRQEWEEAYLEGLDYLGIKIEERTKPWAGAAGVYHPMLMEAVVRFQSQAMQEIFPPAGPAKTRLRGKETPEKLKRASRVQEELNYQLTCRMEEYRPETERLLFRLGLVGSVFRKVYWDPFRKRVSARFVPAEDFVVPYGETDLATAERFTHVNRISKNELRRHQIAGFYRDVDLSDPIEQSDDVTEKEGDITGVRPASIGAERYELLEMHVDLDIEDEDGAPRPYVVTIDKASGTVLAIRRNWKEGDDTYARRSWFVAYEYVPGLGFYGFGLVHLIGGISKSVTAILRQLIDAGTLSNLPGGLKSRGLRIKGDDTPIRPGEFRDVDVVGGKIAEAITFLPYKEPSAVLHNLLQQLVEEGRRVGSIADVDVGDMSSEAPVGTTLALLERAQKVMSAVQSRLHASLGKELKLIAHLIAEFGEDKYDYDFGDEQGNQEFSRVEDFQSTGVEIIPVSDPSATTMSQRVVQHQAALQMASQAPQVYDIPKLHRAGLVILGFPEAEEIVKVPGEEKPMDPVAENMAILMAQPVKAFLHQDHQAHIAVHMAALQDPKIIAMVQQNPMAQAIMAAAQAHLAEHTAYAYRQQLEQMMGQSLPAEGQELSPEQEAEVARAAVPAAQAMLQGNQQEAAQQQAQELVQDPLVQMQAKELALKEADQVRKAQTDMAKLIADLVKSELKANVELARINSQEEIEGHRLGVDIASKVSEHEQRAVDSANRVAVEHDRARSKAEPKGD